MKQNKYINIHTHRDSSPEALNIYCVSSIDETHISLSPGNYYSLGMHPWNLSAHWKDQWLEIQKQLIHPKVLFVGECGLDKLCSTPMDWQLAAFQTQIEYAETIQKPVIIHCVKAFDELIQIHRKLHPQMPWIIHGFRGKPQQMHQLLKQGFLFSFGTHFNPESVRQCPKEAFFLETDDSSSDIQDVYRRIAECRKITVEELILEQHTNFSRIKVASDIVL